MTIKKFSDLTLTEQRAYAKRVSAGLPGADYYWFKVLTELNPSLMNCGIKGIGWAYMAPNSFKQFINILSKSYE
jgi:hypothetical protein